MKPKFTLLLAVILTLNATASTDLPAEPLRKELSVNSFGSFNVHRQHNFAVLSWTFDSNASVFIIKRSYDGNNFFEISRQGLGTARWNKFTDESVEPGTIYYKIIAVVDGIQEESPVAEVRIVRHK